MNSCVSGIGEIQVGEGIFSLPRGILYGGTKNIIFSIFDIIDNEKTVEFTEKFYFYVFEKGFSYSKALQHTQIDFINNNESVMLWLRTIIGN